MSLCMKKSLRKLSRLKATALHEINLRIRGDLGGAEWKLGVALLATSRKKRYSDLGFPSLTEYAEKSLHLSGKKACLLMLTARALEHLPRTSEAYQEGRLCWAKLRALQTVLTPETEVQWLGYAVCHRTDQVVRAVASSPAAWKQQEALRASLAEKPIASPAEVEEVLGRLEPSIDPEPERVGPGRAEGPARASSSGEASVLGEDQSSDGALDETGRLSDGPGAPTVLESLTEQTDDLPRSEALVDGQTSAFIPPKMPEIASKKIRLTVEMTPDQFVKYEMAERHARAQMGRRADRAQVLVHMAEAQLLSSSSRTRLRYQVIVHQSAGAEHSWYETGDGPLPVAPEIVEQAQRDATRTAKREAARAAGRDVKARANCPVAAEDAAAASSIRKPTTVAKSDDLITGPTGSASSAGHRAESTVATFSLGRQPVPAAVLRALYGRAGGCCERCGSSGLPLQVHHQKPVSEGGDNALETLELLCPACHHGHHETDFQTKPHWTEAREKAISASMRGGSSAVWEHGPRYGCGSGGSGGATEPGEGAALPRCFIGSG